MTNTTIWRCGNGTPFGGMTFSSTVAVSSVTFDTLTIFGCPTQNIYVAGAMADCTFINLVSNGDTTFATSNGLLNVGGIIENCYFESCDFSTVTGIKTAHSIDINVGGNARFAMFARNCKFGGTAEVNNAHQMPEGGWISSQKNDQTSGQNKTWMRSGVLSLDTTLFNTASPSARLAPNQASPKLASAPLYSGRGFHKEVASGATSAVSVYVRKSATGSGDAASYDGNQPRLIVRRCVVAGITTDTVLATASGAAGSWEKLSGTTASVSEDCVLEFVVDCDGTAGWINVDDFA